MELQEEVVQASGPGQLEGLQLDMLPVECSVAVVLVATMIEAREALDPGARQVRVGLAIQIRDMIVLGLEVRVGGDTMLHVWR